LIDLKDTTEVVEYSLEDDGNNSANGNTSDVTGVITGNQAKAVRDVVKDYLTANQKL